MAGLYDALASPSSGGLSVELVCGSLAANAAGLAGATADNLIAAIDEHITVKNGGLVYDAGNPDHAGLIPTIAGSAVETDLRAIAGVLAARGSVSQKLAYLAVVRAALAWRHTHAAMTEALFRTWLEIA